MASDFINRIRENQLLTVDPNRQPGEHIPKVLYVGCVDARLDPIRDIGLGNNNTIILRNIGGMIAGRRPDGSAISADQAAAVGFAVEVKNVEHIVVAAHTCCGGLQACLSCGPMPKDLERYLEPLNELRDTVLAKHPQPGEAQEKMMRELLVRQSLSNLMTHFPAVKQRIEDRKLEIHGWVLNTGTREILEFDKKSLAFEPMLALRQRERDNPRY